MVKPDIEVILNLSAADSLSACYKAVSAAGWRINNHNDNSLSCTKNVKNSFLLTIAIKADLQIIGLAPAQSKIIIRASDEGFASIYSKQVNDNVEGLVSVINQESKKISKRAIQQSLPSRRVVINALQLGDDEVRNLEQMFRMPIQNGMYWYDSFSGAWGVQGGPVTGFIQSGLKLGGPLRADASNGNTGVFINGRHLHMMDVVGLQQITPVYPGRYWVDAMGNFGIEGGPMFGNLWAISKNTSSGNGGGAWTAKSSSGTVGGDGQGYVFFDGKDGTSWSN